jgi:hypothetical protein
MSRSEIVNNIFDEKQDFTKKALQVFQYQFANNTVYRSWNDILNVDIASVSSLDKIPFLPVSFFKTHEVVCGDFEPELIFESSGTTTQIFNSRHYVKDALLYTTSFLKGFEKFYGDIKEWCVLGLLPSYLERKNSSLVFMVDELIKQSHNANSNFYLYDFEKLNAVLRQLETQQQKTLLIGVTFALLDFSERFLQQLNNTIVMETGGMKGRRKEMTREEVHEILCQNLRIDKIHSEYGMTELLSQAYSKGYGKFYCPPWMKILVRDEEDPLVVKEFGRGVLNVIDLANIDRCSFIATDDAGTVHEDGSFEVHGRIDNSDIRGCSLMVV